GEEIPQLVSSQHIQFVGHGFGYRIAVVGEAGSFASFVGGDHNYPIGCSCAVDGGGGSVFQHLYRSDFIRRYQVNRCTRNPIYNVKGLLRTTAAEGRGASQDHRGLLVRVTASGDIDARHLSLNQLFGGADQSGIEVLAAETGDGAGKFRPVDLSVTDHNYFIQGGHILSQGNVDDG